VDQHDGVYDHGPSLGSTNHFALCVAQQRRTVSPDALGIITKTIKILQLHSVGVSFIILSYSEIIQMKFAAFKYTDTKGKISQRKLLVLDQPSNKLTGIDVTELEAPQAQQLAREYDRLLDAFRQSVVELYADFDVEHNFRQFLQAKIENLQVTQAY